MCEGIQRAPLKQPTNLLLHFELNCCLLHLTDDVPSFFDCDEQQNHQLHSKGAICKRFPTNSDLNPGYRPGALQGVPDLPSKIC